MEIDTCGLSNVEVRYVIQLEIAWTPSGRLVWLA